MSPQPRKLFRVLAGVIAVLGFHSLLDNGASALAGSYKNLSSVIVALIFAAEFGCIAVRGDGLWLYKSDRFKKDKTKPTEQLGA